MDMPEQQCASQGVRDSGERRRHKIDVMHGACEGGPSPALDMKLNGSSAGQRPLRNIMRG
jgi:hypothetical protein